MTTYLSSRLRKWVQAVFGMPVRTRVKTLDEQIQDAQGGLHNARLNGWGPTHPQGTAYYAALLQGLLAQKAANMAANAYAQHQQSTFMGAYTAAPPWQQTTSVQSGVNPNYGSSIGPPPNINEDPAYKEYEAYEKMKTLTFGKHAGQDIALVPADYIQWLLGKAKQDVADYEGELARREAVETANTSIAERIVKAGFRELAKTLHPDKGGDAKEFQELTKANEQLKMVLEEIKNVKSTTAP